MNKLLAGLFLASMFLMPWSVADAESVELRYRSYRNWSIQLPDEQWFSVTGGIKIPHAGGDAFAVGFIGNDLRFDTDGDGQLDRTIKPLVDPKTQVSTTRVIFSGTSKSGEAFRYAARLRNDANGWEWAPGGAMAGTVPTPAGPIPIRVIDRNGNGRYDDIGSDAMVVGSSDYATLLSKTIFFDDALQQVDYSPDGRSFQMAPYDGPTAEIDMTSSFRAKAMVLSLVIASADGQHSFDVGAIEGAAQVPAGSYSVVSGMIGLGEQRVTVAAGRMKPLKLSPDTSQEFEWGGPVESEFQVARLGNQLQFSPNHIWYYGSAGEQYTGWSPCGKSPEFRVIDADTGAVLEVVVLPGSC